MLRRHLPILLFTLGACATPASAPARTSAGTPAYSDAATISAELIDVYDDVRVAGLEDRRFNHGTYWRAVAPYLGGNVSSTRAGQSVEGREIRHLTFGSGPTTVLLWSQMHGDESTASMALADITRFFHERGDHPVARRIAQGATVHMIPMLNPDGAQRFQRRNAQGIDVNRDARRLQTPEGRVLKAVTDALGPDFGSNLHEQGAAGRVAGPGTYVAGAECSGGVVGRRRPERHRRGGQHRRFGRGDGGGQRDVPDQRRQRRHRARLRSGDHRHPECQHRGLDRRRNDRQRRRHRFCRLGGGWRPVGDSDHRRHRRYRRGDRGRHHDPEDHDGQRQHRPQPAPRRRHGGARHHGLDRQRDHRQQPGADPGGVVGGRRPERDRGGRQPDRYRDRHRGRQPDRQGDDGQRRHHPGQPRRGRHHHSVDGGLDRRRGVQERHVGDPGGVDLLGLAVGDGGHRRSDRFGQRRGRRQPGGQDRGGQRRHRAWHDRGLGHHRPHHQRLDRQRDHRERLKRRPADLGHRRQP
ncbi:MAG: hypothetical protein IIA44_07215, partial [Acidobacteria bacterium]|nr:hypothetical protein [Acidobacteriota bacterium]